MYDRFSFSAAYNSPDAEIREIATNSRWNGMFDGWFAAVFVI